MAISPVYSSFPEYNPSAAMPARMSQPQTGGPQTAGTSRSSSMAPEQAQLFTQTAMALTTEIGRTIGRAQMNNAVIPPRDLSRIAKALNKTYHVVESVHKQGSQSNWWA